jgi:hypothetical protein
LNSQQGIPVEKEKTGKKSGKGNMGYRPLKRRKL